MSNEIEITAWDLPEDTCEQIIEKISSLAWEIRGDWTDPRGECKQIIALCEKLSSMLSEREGGSDD